MNDLNNKKVLDLTFKVGYENIWIVGYKVGLLVVFPL